MPDEWYEVVCPNPGLLRYPEYVATLIAQIDARIGDDPLFPVSRRVWTGRTLADGTGVITVRVPALDTPTRIG